MGQTVLSSIGDIEDTMDNWTTAGFSEMQLDIAVPFHAAYGAGRTGRTPNKEIHAAISPEPSDNSGWYDGHTCCNGPDLAEDKVEWILYKKFGGGLGDLGSDLTRPIICFSKFRQCRPNLWSNQPFKHGSGGKNPSSIYNTILDITSAFSWKEN